jgi:hypothetical protein
VNCPSRDIIEYYVLIKMKSSWRVKKRQKVSWGWQGVGRLPSRLILHIFYLKITETFLIKIEDSPG